MRRCVLVSLALLFGGGEVLAQQKRDCEASLRLKPGDNEYALSRGICHLNNGDADLAISDFDQFIALNPTWVAGYFNRGNAYYRKQDYDRAIEDFGQGLRLSPSTPESMLLNRGNAYRDKRDHEKAIADYSEAIRLKPKFDELYRIRGDTYERKGELDRARDDYRAALALNPGNRASSEGLKRLGTAPAPLVQVVTIANPRIGEVRLDWCREWARSCGKAAADEFCRSQGFVEARSFVKAPRLQEPTRVIGTGQTCSNASCDGFASIACRKAESQPPSPPAASLGQCDRTAHPDQRIAACTAVVERGEGGNNILASAYLNRCDAQAFSGKLDQALADCSKAIELDPAAAFAFAIRGRLHSMKREYELALKDMDEAIRLQPRESGFLCDRASVYEAAGQAERAIEDYSQAIRLDPRAGQPYISRGILYSNGGKFAEALADFNAVINLDPKSHVAFFNRGTVYRRMVQYDSAIADYDEAIRLSPTYVLAYLRRADAYFDKGQYDRAVDDYSQGLAHRPNDPTIYYLRARAIGEGGHYDRALADHGEALRINPDSRCFQRPRLDLLQDGQSRRGVGRCHASVGTRPEIVACL